MRRPRIGITSGLGRAEWLADGESWRSYALAIELAGGEAIHLDAATIGREGEVIGSLDGLVFSGGQDVDLDLYPNPPDLGGRPAAEVMAQFRMKPEPDRDRYELPLLEAALQRDTPLLGICRGCQVLNVALGGRLILDIELEVETRLQHRFHLTPEPNQSRHAVRILPGTHLAGILDPEQFSVCNTYHHQAVRMDESFSARLAAISPEDGVVEAIEVPGRRWMIGVQWHPEHRRDDEFREMYAPLFRAFIEASR
jgi:gamma-glutamyl-gamma-aminobutyrate hydrolase PuuD